MRTNADYKASKPVQPGRAAFENSPKQGAG
jgi:hypothetical protein